MHELSLAMSVMEIITGELDRRGNPRLTGIDVAVGELSGVEPETFAAAMESVLASGGHPEAVCRLIPVTGRAECLACRECFTAKGRFPVCPRCGSGECIVTAGTEFRITSISIDK